MKVSEKKHNISLSVSHLITAIREHLVEEDRREVDERWDKINDEGMAFIIMVTITNDRYNTDDQDYNN